MRVSSYLHLRAEHLTMLSNSEIVPNSIARLCQSRITLFRMKFILKDQQFPETQLHWVCSQIKRKRLRLKPLGKVEVQSELPLIKRVLKIPIESSSLLHYSQNNMVSSVSYKERITGLCMLIRVLVDIVY